ncbi:hypothetical protein EHQ31_16115 [Leptospira montravelensis]|uniref:Cytochrome c554 and C-prime n=1 Tax=Leptospira montravelensis TaxID=2484961 RepID=A0ABY2LMC3_9LEPT|nr:hypothetical protein [Leptospira montravelensis]TGK80159.1 hypothetical protein EHQ19_10690 [Leptospira montravelensis]TGL00329.1 hypothetical protein EHQ31_16115 [Leptospira montravelensis]
MLPFFIGHCNQNQPVFPNGLEPVATGWETKNPNLLLNSSCISCHKDIKPHEDRHSYSWKSDLFQEALKIENREWCVHCHAPLSKQKEIYYRKIKNENNISQSDLHLLNEGINCVSCHVRNGKILGYQKRTIGNHEVVESNIGKPEFCANCHQFNFPIFKDDKIIYSNHPMQNTYEEWKSSGIEDSCQSCHYSNHKLVGPNNREWFSDQFYDFAIDTSEEELSLTFKMTTRGHNLPSGDLFRSLVLEISKDSKFQSIIISKRWSRKYELMEKNSKESFGKKLSIDTSLLASKKKIQLIFDKPFISPIFVRLAYYYHDPVLAGKSNVNPSPLVLFKQKIY